MPKIQSHGRREPRQSRALRTRELIFETAIQILEHEGEAALSTNRIAERSGFSVGTIYQYFANKQAILSALTAQERHTRMTRIAAELARGHHDTAPHDALHTRVRAIVRIVLDAFGGRHRARRILLERALRSHEAGVMNRPVEAMAAMLRELTCGAHQRRALTEIEAFVLAQAVSGVIRAAVSRNPDLLKDPQFERAVVDLSVGFLTQRHAESGVPD